jgi:hypothetical protein
MIQKKSVKILSIVFISAHMYAQQDSTKIESQQKNAITTATLNDPIFNTLKKREKDEKYLWKFNLLGTFFKGLDISYERKIAPKWSLNINSITNLQSFNFGSTNALNWAFNEPLQNINFSQSLSFQLRYYYNLDKRTRQGKTTRFSGNYFGLEQSNSYNHYNFNGLYPFLFSDSFSGNGFSTSLNLVYGIQRKIGKAGYIDASAGLGIRHNEFGQFKETVLWPTAKIAIGLAH